MLPRKVSLHIPWQVLLSMATTLAAAAASTTDMATTSETAKPGCPLKCGNLTIPYPFGVDVGPEGYCSMNRFYNIVCNNSFNPPRPFLPGRFFEIVDISETYLKIMRPFIAKSCYDTSSGQVTEQRRNSFWARGPFTFSDTQNKFTVIGCDDYAFIEGVEGRNFTGGCISYCSNVHDVTAGSCAGIGCCQTDIPNGLHKFNIALHTYNNHTRLPQNQSCSYAFLSEKDRFQFRGALDLSDPKFEDRIINHVPIVLDWDVGNGTKCIEARKDRTNYACQGNSNCTDSNTASKGYRCSCLLGYEGNPYLHPGCTDIDECVQGLHNCTNSNSCSNTLGSYKCVCPGKYKGDGFKNGTGCDAHNNSELALKSGLGASCALLFVLFLSSMAYITIRTRGLAKMREKFFEQNGGLLLKQLLSSNHNGMQSTKIFTTSELKLATNNYSEDCILGRGGYGTVYKGMLHDNCVVAIKKSKVTNQSQIEQFINEMVILTGIDHRNVVKVLGCCLEEEVPILVYEFISNGTLFELIHKKTSWLSWANCVRIAAESASALSYLFYDASIPIIHRDIKSANILIDDMYVAKIADFGVSRLVPLDETQVPTVVLGTLGYLDPEYLSTSQLTEKSDVYSFGVVLAELLTREKPLCPSRKEEDRNVSTYLVRAMKEDRLLEVVHPQLIKEANKEQLEYMANLVKRCVNVKGDDRPSMKEVAFELDNLNKTLKNPWNSGVSYEEEDTNLLQRHTSQIDLYPTPDSYKHTSTSGDSSEQYLLQLSMMGEKNRLR